MTHSNKPDDLSDLEDLDTRQAKEERVLRSLLDKQREKAGHLLAVKVKMGNTRSYITSVTLQWVAEHVRYVADLPIFKDHADKKTKAIDIDSKTIDFLQQRNPDWSRQFEMTSYLVKKEHHKFPTILVVSSKDWVYEEEADEWVDSKATEESINAKSLDSNGQYYDLVIDEGVILYAIDGQHRLMAIQGLRTLLSESVLHRYNKDKKPIKDSMRIDDLTKENEIGRGDLQNMMSERIGIEIIPAVSQGDTKIKALRRLKTIFVDINRAAKRTTAGETYVLDEDDGYAVVARMASFNHELLRNRVGNKKKQLADSSKDYTTLETLVHISGSYLSPQYHWPLGDKEKAAAIRPEEEEIEEAYKKLKAYLDALKNLPSHKELINGKNASDIRKKEGDDHILFRPVAQMALAEAISYLEKEDQDCTLEKLFEILITQDKKSVFKLTEPSNPWYGVICDIGELRKKSKVKMLAKKKNRNLCAKLFIHLLGRGTKDHNSRNELKKLFIEARSIDKGKAINFNGQEVPDGEIELPSPWPW